MSAIASPADALRLVWQQLRAGPEQLAAVAVEPGPGCEPFFGALAAAGERAASAPGRYAFAIEAIREGYLLHYGEPRLVVTDDADLALLAGDFLYALGLEQISALGDTEAVAELAELISDCATIHAGDPAEAGALAEARWSASASRIGGQPRR